MQPSNFDKVNGFTATLRDGVALDLKPVTKDDWQTIQNGMSKLSSQSRYFRFFSAIAKLSDTQLHYLTEVDQHDHVAWIALEHDAMRHPGVGIARFIRFRDQPEIAEFAVTVIDRYQRRGLGTLLMAVLYVLASSQAVTILRGFVLPENTVTTRWLSTLGATAHYENGIYRMDLEVAKNLSVSPTPPLLQFLADHVNVEKQPVE